MSKGRTSSASGEPKKIRPALTPLAQENQLISLGVDLAMKKLMDGTASSQLICQVLKLASDKERLEREKLEHENELLRAKTKAIESGRKVEELYDKAMRAFSAYQGDGDFDEDDDDPYL